MTEPLTPDAVRALIASLRHEANEDARIAAAMRTDHAKRQLEHRAQVSRDAALALEALLPRGEADFDAGLQAAVVAALDDALLCTRVWDAWSYGTMREDDFMQAADDPKFVAQIVDAVRPFLASRTVETVEELWGVVLDDFGSTDYYETREEADEARKSAPDTALVRVVTTTIVPPTPEEADR